MFDFLCSPPDEQRRLTHRLAANRVWFALTRRATLSAETRRALERSGRIMHVFGKGPRVAACKGSCRAARRRAVKSKEDWSLWASTAALRLQSTKGALKRALEAVRLTDDGIVPLQLTDREAQLGPASAAYALDGVTAATVGSLRKPRAMGAAMVAKDGKIQPQSVAVYGPPSSIRPKLTGISLAVEKCPVEENLNILTEQSFCPAAPQGYAMEGLTTMAPQAYGEASTLAGGPTN